MGGGSSAWAAEQTASFSLISYTVTNGKAAITSSDNTNVSLTLARDGANIGGADSKSRGFRVQTNMYFEISVPEGKYITKVDFTANSNGNISKNPDTDGKFGIWSITGESNTWVLSAKAANYIWTNGGTNLSSPMIFKQTGNGDIYVSAVKVYYDDAPTLDNEAPTITTQPTNKTTTTGVATTISVAAEGIPAPSYQWYSCDDANKTNAQKIDDATNNTYDFSSNVAGTYYFYVEASNEEGNATSNVVTVTVNQSYVMTFANGDADFIGTLPAAIRTNGELKVTTPKYNYSLYLAGKTFVHWTDGVNNYLPNTEYTLASDVTVTPVFEDNIISLNKLSEAKTVNFIKSSSIAATYQSSNKNAVVEQLTDGGNSVDLALIIQNGKFDLQPTGPRAQTNQNTVVSIPVTNGAIVVIDIYDNNTTKAWNCTINDEEVSPYLAEVNSNVKKMTYVYNGSKSYINYVVNASQMYANCIDVTYPRVAEDDATLASVSVNGNNMNSFASETVEYNYGLAYGTVAAPVVTAVPTVNGVDVNITQAEAVDGSAVIEVTALDGVTTKTYTINFYVKDAEVTFKTTGTGAKDDETKNLDNVTVAGLIPGKYIAGITGSTGLKLRSNTATDNFTKGLQINVEAGKVIKKVVLGTSQINSSTGDLSVNNVYVDGKALAGWSAVELPVNTTTKDVTINVGEAKKSIEIELTTTDGSAPQWRSAITVTYNDCPIISEDITVSAAGWASYYNSEKAIELPEGVVGYTAYMNPMTMNLTVEPTYDENNNVVPAGEPILVKAAPGTYTLNYTECNEEPLVNLDMNELIGTDVETVTTHPFFESEECYFYGLSLNAAGDINSVGFYWIEDEGAPFAVPAHKVYLAYEKDMIDYLEEMATPELYSRSRFLLNPGTTAAIVNVQTAAAKQNVMFNLAGQRVNANAKGIILVNGKKVVK